MDHEQLVVGVGTDVWNLGSFVLLHKTRMEKTLTKEEQLWQPLSFSHLQKATEEFHGTPETPRKSPKPTRSSMSLLGEATALTGWLGKDKLGNVLPSLTQKQERSSLLGNLGTLEDSMATVTVHNTIPGTGDLSPNYWRVSSDSSTTTNQHTLFFDDSTNVTAENYTIAGNSFSANHWRVETDGSMVIQFDSVQAPGMPEMPNLALKRAEKLLRGMLTTKQRKMYERFGFFDVRSPSQKHIAYRIPKSGLIVMYEHGVPKTRLCVYEKEGLPKGDWLVAAKMLCEADENDLMQVANHHPLTRHKPNDPRVDRVPLWLPGKAA